MPEEKEFSYIHPTQWKDCQDAYYSEMMRTISIENRLRHEIERDVMLSRITPLEAKLRSQDLPILVNIRDLYNELTIILGVMLDTIGKRKIRVHEKFTLSIPHQQIIAAKRVEIYNLSKKLQTKPYIYV